MISTTKKQRILQMNHLKNYILVFGVCLCFLTITSFNNWSSSDNTACSQVVQCELENQSKNVQKTLVAPKETKFKARHNFIASYLLQESSFERKTKNTEEKGSFFSNLKQLHKIIISQTLGSF